MKEINVKAHCSLSGFTLKTGRAESKAIFTPGGYRLVLVKDGNKKSIDLGFSGSRVLERLLKEPGQLVSREELIKYGWPGRVVGQGSLNQQIHALRQHLADCPQSEIIQTVPRRGYIFNPRFYAGQAASQLTQEFESSASARPRTQRRHFHRAIAASIGIVAAGAVVLAYGAALASQVTLVRTEVNGGHAFILYVAKDKAAPPQEWVTHRQRD